MPQARSGGSKRSSSSSGSRSTRASSSRASTSKSSRSGSAGRASASGSRSGSSASRSRSTRSGDTRSTGARAGTADPRFEAAAQRLRKLNERIIEAGRDAGETTLASYEKALKTIASSLERGPGSSDVEWVSHLATAQAKFIRDVTAAWTAAARKVLK